VKETADKTNTASDAVCYVDFPDKEYKTSPLWTFSDYSTRII